MRRPRMLVVDDENQNVRLLERVFRKTFEFTGFTDPRAAVEACMEETFDVIICDQRMPEMTGTMFLKEVLGRQPKSYRVLLTGYSDLEAAIDAINDGHVHRYVKKPFDREELRGLVEKSLELISIDKKVHEYYAELQQEVQRLRDENIELRDRLTPFEDDAEESVSGADSPN